MIKKLLRGILTLCLAAALMLPMLGTASAGYGIERITSADDPRISEMLAGIEKQSFSSIDAATAQYFMNHFVFTSSFAPIGGSTFDYPNSNSGWFYEVTDGTYTQAIRGAKGCMAHARFISQVVYGMEGDKLMEGEAIGAITGAGLSEFIRAYLQAGEQIRIEDTHSVAFISSTKEGFYYMSYKGDSDPYIELCYATYDQFADYCNSVKGTVFVYNADEAVNAGVDVTEPNKNPTAPVELYQYKYITLTIDNAMMDNNGTLEAIDEQGTTPIIMDGHTLIPVRAMIEAMGGTVGWDDAEKRIDISCGGVSIAMYIDSANAYVDGVWHGLDVAPVIVNGRTMLPVRFIAESLGAGAQWFGGTKSAVITYLDPTPTELATYQSYGLGIELAFQKDWYDRWVVVEYADHLDFYSADSYYKNGGGYLCSVYKVAYGGVESFMEADDIMLSRSTDGSWAYVGRYAKTTDAAPGCEGQYMSMLSSVLLDESFRLI